MPSLTATHTPPGEQPGPDDPADSPSEPGGRHHPFDGEPNETGQVEFVNAAGPSHAVDTGWLTAKLNAVCSEVRRPIRRVTVRIVGDSEMARLHERHSGVQGTTDVLTFDATEANGPIDVDIAVCVDEAARHAAEFGHTVERELLLYAVHGLLHCLGFDDHTDHGHQRMHAEEDRLLGAVGVQPTFAPRQARANNKTE